MGASCSKPRGAPRLGLIQPTGATGGAMAGNAGGEGGTLGVMFKRFDKHGKGFISRDDLKRVMADDKTHFGGNDVDRILEKYGTSGQMTFEQFKMWWGSTYTSYNDDDNAIAQLVDEVHDDNPNLQSIAEGDEASDLVQEELIVSRS
jgi:hypothetical protein